MADHAADEAPSSRTEPTTAPSDATQSSFSKLEATLAKHEAWVLAALFVLALAPRLHVATHWAREPVWDGHYYHFGAQRIASGFGYGDERLTAAGPVFHPWCHYPVGYSGFLALFYAIFGDSPRVAVAVQAVLGALTVVVVHQLARRIVGPIRALAAGLLATAHPVLVIYSGLVMTEPLAALGALLGPLVFLRTARRPLAAAGLGGVVLGLTTLVRPQSLLLAPALALLARGARLKTRAAVAAVSTAACLAVVVPWSVRNCVVMDGCALVSTNGGWNLAIGSSPRATGRFEALTADDGCKLVTGQVQQDRCWSAKGREWISDDPVRWLALIPKKLAFTFDHQSFAIGYLSQSDPASWPEERRAWWRRVQTVAQWLLLGLGALGLIPRPSLDRRRWPHALASLAILGALVLGREQVPPTIWPLAVAIPLVGLIPPRARERSGLALYLALSVGALVVVHAVFFGEDRYQVVAIPALCVLAACAWRPDVERSEAENADA